MADIKWQDATAVVTLMTTELNSLATNARANIAHDNGTDLDLYGDFELNLGTITAPADGDKIAELYIFPTIDGTNFPDPGTGTGDDPQAIFLVGVFAAVGTGTTPRLGIVGVPIPPRNARYLLKNVDATAFAASGNTLKVKKYKLQG